MSSLREGGPYTLAESLLLQRPVLGTNVGMMAEFVPADFLCGTGSSASLNNLIGNYLLEDDPSILFTMTYERAKEQLTFQKMIENTIKTYQNLLRS